MAIINDRSKGHIVHIDGSQPPGPLNVQSTKTLRVGPMSLTREVKNAKSTTGHSDDVNVQRTRTVKVGPLSLTRMVKPGEH